METNNATLTLNEYQDFALSTAAYPNKGFNFIYPTLGLAGESGEVAEKVKKIIRDHEGILNDTHRLELAKEVSDCLWYCAALAYELGFSLEELAKINIEKLKSRKERGVIGGSGDNR